MKQVLVIYDNDCALCEKFRKTIEWMDWLSLIQFSPLQDQEAYKHLPLTEEDCKHELKLVSANQKISGGGDAIIQIFIKIPLLCGFGALLWLPPLRQGVKALYGFIAKNRYKISSQCGLRKK